jgi:hypothetical protein
MNEVSITPEQIEFAGLQRINYSKLPWEEKLTIMWGWFWRTMLVSAGTGTFVGIFLSLATTLILTAAGNLDPRVYLVIFVLLAVPTGVMTTHPLIHWVLSSRIGSYRIVLCKKRDDEGLTLANDQERKIVAF